MSKDFESYFRQYHFSYNCFRTVLFVQLFFVRTFRTGTFRTNFSYKYFSYELFVQVLFVRTFRTGTFRTNTKRWGKITRQGGEKSSPKEQFMRGYTAPYARTFAPSPLYL